MLVNRTIPSFGPCLKRRDVHMKMATGCRKITENPDGSRTAYWSQKSEASLKFHQKQCEKKRATRLGGLGED